MAQMSRGQSRAQGQSRYADWMRQSGPAVEDVNQKYGGTNPTYKSPDDALAAFLTNSSAQNYLSPYAVNR